MVRCGWLGYWARIRRGRAAGSLEAFLQHCRHRFHGWQAWADARQGGGWALHRPQRIRHSRAGGKSAGLWGHCRRSSSASQWRNPDRQRPLRRQLARGHREDCQASSSGPSNGCAVETAHIYIPDRELQSPSDAPPRQSWDSPKSICDDGGLEFARPSFPTHSLQLGPDGGKGLADGREGRVPG